MQLPRKENSVLRVKNPSLIHISYYYMYTQTTCAVVICQQCIAFDYTFISKKAVDEHVSFYLYYSLMICAQEN